MIKYSIVIATYNRYISLQELINRLTKQENNEELEIVIVDQTENYMEFSDSLSRQNITYIHSEVKGLSKSRNLGIQRAKGKYILIMDDDIMVETDYIRKLDEIVEKNECDVICGKILTMENNRPYSRYMSNKKTRINSINYNKCLSTTLCFNRKDLLRIGMFDNNFGVAAKYGGSEETDLILRMLWGNKKIVYYPELVVYHPKYDHALCGYNDVFKKSFTYGVGRGAMYRKHMEERIIWASKEFILSLLKSTVGFIGATLVLDFKGATRFSATLCGRVVGFMIYSNTHNIQSAHEK